MSSPYGPPGGQQGSGSYGGPGGAPWTPGPNVPGYGARPQGGPGGYGQGSQGVGPAPGQGYAPAYGSGPEPRGSGPGGPEGDGQDAPRRRPAKPGTAPDLARILPLVVGGLGVLAFFFGFLSAWKLDQQGSDASISVYATAGAYLPILLLLVGVLAVAPLIPKGRKYTLPTALLAIVGFLAALTQLISGDGSYGANLSVGAGLILLILVALLQAAAATYAWLTESGVIKLPTSGQSRTRTKKPAAEPTSPPQFAPPSSAAPQTGAQSSYGGGYAPGAYPAGGYAPPAGTAASDAPAYGGYRPNPYSPSSPADEPRNPYATGAPAPQQFGTGATPTVDPGPLDDSPYRPGGRYSEAPSTGPSAGQHGRNDGPSPDETQQVRF